MWLEAHDSSAIAERNVANFYAIGIAEGFTTAGWLRCDRPLVWTAITAQTAVRARRALSHDPRDLEAAVLAQADTIILDVAFALTDLGCIIRDDRAPK